MIKKKVKDKFQKILKIILKNQNRKKNLKKFNQIKLKKLNQIMFLTLCWMKKEILDLIMMKQLKNLDYYYKIKN